MKNTLKNNYNHTLKQILIRTQPKSNNQITKKRKMWNYTDFNKKKQWPMGFMDETTIDYS
jgi:hypothetical protein